MNPPDNSEDPQLPTIKIRHPSPPHHPSSTATPTAGASRKVGVAVDLSDESAFAVRWAVQNYIRPGDAAVLLHVSPTSVPDWWPLPQHYSNSSSAEQPSQQQMEDDFDAYTVSKVDDLARPLKEAQIPYEIHIVKDHDTRERLCLEVERLGLYAVIMGSRGFGTEKGSVSNYCVQHCVCDVVVVRYPDDKEGSGGEPIVTIKEVEEEDVTVKPEGLKGQMFNGSWGMLLHPPSATGTHPVMIP